MKPLSIFGWHVHGSYSTVMVQGPHTYLYPVLPDRGPYGRGRAQSWTWPDNAVEVTPQSAAQADVDVVVLQRPEELDLAEAWLGGRRPGRDIPAIYLEHNAPQGRVNDMVHPMADRHDMLIVHVTNFNRLFWDCGTTPTTVIEHGVIDSGYQYSGAIEHGAAVINEPVRRARVTGTDLLAVLSDKSGVPIDLFGMKTESLGGVDVSQNEMHSEIARRRFYLHPIRWTSLGLSLIEAMTMGIPVVGLATTEAAEVLPPEVGVLSNNLDKLAGSMRAMVDDPDLARLCGKHAREVALQKFGLDRFLGDWDEVFQRVTA